MRRTLLGQILNIETEEPRVGDEEEEEEEEGVEK